MNMPRHTPVRGPSSKVPVKTPEGARCPQTRRAAFATGGHLALAGFTIAGQVEDAASGQIWASLSLSP